MTTRAIEAPQASRRIAVVGDYARMTKPRVVSLLLLTTLCAMLAAARGWPSGWIVLWTMVGGYLSAGGAHAINQYVDRDIDARMPRTTGRPVASGRVAPRDALAFGVALAVLSTVHPGLPGQLAGRRPGPDRPGPLRGPVHALAQAGDGAQHRDRRRRRRRAAAGGVGRGDRATWRSGPGCSSRSSSSGRPPLLGPVAGAARRLRPGRRADAAGGLRRARDPAADPLVDAHRRRGEPAALRRRARPG